MSAPEQQIMMKGNKEGEDIEPPLSSAWTLEKLKSGEIPVRIFGNLPSPSNTRLRFLFNYYGIPFTISECAYAKVDKTWEYKKMPVVRFGTKENVAAALANGDPDKGRIINDGFVVVKSLAPILQGRPFSDDELKVEKYFTFSVQYAMQFGSLKAGSIGCGRPGTDCFPNANCCQKQCCGCCFCCCAPYCLIPCCCNYTCCSGGRFEKMLKGGASPGGDPHVQLKKESFVEAGKKLAEFLGSKQYFSSDDKVSLVDVDIFGYIHYHVGNVGNPYAIAMIDADPKLQGWYERMKGDAAGQTSSFEGLKFAKPLE